MHQESSPFAAIVNGEKQGTVIAQNEEKRFALIESLEPEAAVHWLAVPYDTTFSTEDLQQQHSQRFLDLIDYALAQTKALIPDYPILGNGFTIKFHVGAFETIPQAKLHILSTE